MSANRFFCSSQPVRPITYSGSSNAAGHSSYHSFEFKDDDEEEELEEDDELELKLA